jgi:hypothetical protein
MTNTKLTIPYPVVIKPGLVWNGDGWSISKDMADFHNDPELYWRDFCNDCHHGCSKHVKLEVCEEELVNQILRGE